VRINEIIDLPGYFAAGHLRRTANYQSKQGQKDDAKHPDNYKKMVAETEKYSHV